MGHQVIPLSVYKSLQSLEIQGVARIYLCFTLGRFQLNLSGISSFVGRNVGHNNELLIAQHRIWLFSQAKSFNPVDVADFATMNPH